MVVGGEVWVEEGRPLQWFPAAPLVLNPVNRAAQAPALLRVLVRAAGCAGAPARPCWAQGHTAR